MLCCLHEQEELQLQHCINHSSRTFCFGHGALECQRRLDASCHRWHCARWNQPSKLSMHASTRNVSRYDTNCMVLQQMQLPFRTSDEAMLACMIVTYVVKAVPTLATIAEPAPAFMACARPIVQGETVACSVVSCSAQSRRTARDRAQCNQ